MISLGLIGKNIAHSKSQEIYERLLNRPITYTLLDFESPTEIPPLSDLLKNYDGLSVTSPYKSFLFKQEFAESLIKPFGSTNCIRLQGNTIQMTNTDFLAIREILPSLVLNHSINNCIVLGNGSMASIVTAILKVLGIPNRQFCRSQNGDLNSVDYNSIIMKKPAGTLLINCCSRDFVFTAAIPKQTVFWDFNYSMKEHDHLRQVCHYLDGLDLLYKQAEHALKYWSIS